MDINLLTISSTVAAIQERQTTATTLVEDFYRKIEAEDKGKTNAYLTLSRERALAQAARERDVPLIIPNAGNVAATRELCAPSRRSSMAPWVSEYRHATRCKSVAPAPDQGRFILQPVPGSASASAATPITRFSPPFASRR